MADNYKSFSSNVLFFLHMFNSVLLWGSEQKKSELRSGALSTKTANSAGFRKA